MTPAPDALTVTRVHEDDALIVVAKPSGLPSQAPDGGGDNVYDRLRAVHPYVALHHRLDAGASGLVLFVVDPRANQAIARAFRDHAIARTYRAVGVGEPAPGPWTRPVDGRPAHTDVDVDGAARGLCALTLRPRTGRKHQLRVHAALAGAPLAGDRAYGDAGVAARWPRLALHAWRMALTHPLTGARLALEVPLPDDLAPLWLEATGQSR